MINRVELLGDDTDGYECILYSSGNFNNLIIGTGLTKQATLNEAKENMKILNEEFEKLWQKVDTK